MLFYTFVIVLVSKSFAHIDYMFSSQVGIMHKDEQLLNYFTINYIFSNLIGVLFSGTFD